MTNALAQNIESNNSSAADLLMQAVNVSSNTNVQENSEVKFSNIINNAQAKTQKVQDDFNHKAKVSNISSINKKALEKKSTNENIQADERNIKEVSKKEEKVLTLSSTKEKTQVSEEKKSIKKEKTNNQLENSFSATDENVVVKKENDTEKLSDINNNSPVNTSPVFSSEENVDEVDLKKQEVAIETAQNQEVVIETSNVVVQEGVNFQEKIEKLKETIDEIESIENLEQLNTVIDEISSSLNDSNLNQEQKDEIQNLLDELSQNLSKIDNETIKTIDFTQTLQVLKKEIENISNDVEVKNVDLKVDNKNNVNLEKNVDLKQEEIQVKNENKDNEILNEVSKITKELGKDILEAFEKKDFEKLSEIKNELPKIIEDIKTILNNENVEIESTDKTLELDNNLVSLLEELQELLPADKNIDKTLNKNNKVITIDLSQVKDTLEKIDSITKDLLTQNLDSNKDNKTFELLDKLASIDVEKLDKTAKLDKETMDEILNVLSELDTEIENEDVDLDIQNQVQELIKKVEDEKISNDEIVNAIDNLSSEIKNEFNKKDTKDVEVKSDLNLNEDLAFENATIFENKDLNQDDNQTLKQEQVEIDYQNENVIAFNQNDTSFNQTLKVDSNKIETKTNELQIDENNTNQQAIDLFQDVDLEIDTKEVSLKGKVENVSDLEQVEQNLQKQIYTQEIMEDMLVEVNVKTIPSQSGALSVADEVAKLALGEQNTLNSVSSSSGTITYDNTGVNAIIKNGAQLIKTAQTQGVQNPSMEEVLSEVTNKIAQLKDASGQKLTMVLRPNDLGRLSIELTSTNQGLTTQIMAQNEDVRAYIEKNINSLRQQLSEAGVNVNTIQIKTAGQEGSTSYEGNQNFNKGQDENLNQQNNKNEQNNPNQQQNKNSKEILNAFSNYDTHFAKDFSSVMNKSLSYGLN